MEVKRPPTRAQQAQAAADRQQSESFRTRSTIGEDIYQFVESFKQKRFIELVALAEAATAYNRKSKKIKLKMPASAFMGAGQNSEKQLMQAFGWYWEPLLHDIAFFEEMRDAVPIIDGSVQKLVDLALDGFALQCGDPEQQDDLNKALLEDPNVNFQEVVRRSMIDTFSLGNCYCVPVWKRDDEGRLVPKVFKPVRANAMRKLRDEDLYTEGYVQLLHRPSEFIMGVPSIPTLYEPDDVLCGIMRSYGWYAYGKPLLSSLPFVIRLKLVMERDLAEMLHQHVPRIDIMYTPEDQMTDEQVATAIAQTKSNVSAMRPTDNFIHTPDTVIEYKGPAGKGLDFAVPQKHMEEQVFYTLPFAKAIMGLDSQSNPFDSQQHWKLSAVTANGLRAAIKMMFAPALNKMAEDWGIDDGITMGFTELDPEGQQQQAMAEEYHVNNAVLKRDNGFIDQDSAAKQATAHQKGGPVKQAAEPGAIPPPTDPNKIDPATGKPFPPAAPAGGAKPAAKKVVNKDKGPKQDGRKVPQGDKRPKGKRHQQALLAYSVEREALLSAFRA